jgi:hypothetical protein
LEDDVEILQAFVLADYLKVPLSVIDAMPLEEIAGWQAFFKWKKDAEGD